MRAERKSAGGPWVLGSASSTLDAMRLAADSDYGRRRKPRQERYLQPPPPRLALQPDELRPPPVSPTVSLSSGTARSRPEGWMRRLRGCDILPVWDARK